MNWYFSISIYVLLNIRKKNNQKILKYLSLYKLRKYLHFFKANNNNNIR